MSFLFAKAIQTAVVLTFANYLYQQLFGGRHWSVAFERSWFQFIAIIIFTQILKWSH